MGRVEPIGVLSVLDRINWARNTTGSNFEAQAHQNYEQAEVPIGPGFSGFYKLLGTSDTVERISA